MANTTAPNFEDAETLRKNQRYSEACEQFKQLWEQNPNQYIGWRYAFCLRKLGQLELAEQVAREALSKYPEDRYTQFELGWIIYEKGLKPLKQTKNLSRAIRFANQILELNSEQLILIKVAMIVMRVAKNLKDWRVLLEWADKLSPEMLNNRPIVIEGKRGMSDRETWYVERARALLELGRFDEARQFAQAGLAEFPEEVFLCRIAALALKGSGDLNGAINEMRALLTHPRADWYMQAELAELEYQAGNHQSAYRLMCEAMSTSRQSEEYQVNYFISLAQIAFTLGKLDVAAAHLTLVKILCATRKWKEPTRFEQVAKAVREALLASQEPRPKIPKDLDQLKRLCRQYWQEGQDEGLQFYRGVLKPYPEGRTYAYILRDDGGEDVFVLVRNLPKSCRKPGSWVEFALRSSFDLKKKRESVQAIRVRCMSGNPGEESGDRTNMLH